MVVVQIKSRGNKLRQLESAMGDANGHPSTRRAVSGLIAEGRTSSCASFSSDTTAPRRRSLSPTPSSEASFASTPRQESGFSPGREPFEWVDAAPRRASAWSVVPAKSARASPALQICAELPTAAASSLSAPVAHPPRIEVPPPRVVVPVVLHRAARVADVEMCEVVAAQNDASFTGEDVFSLEDMAAIGGAMTDEDLILMLAECAGSSNAAEDEDEGANASPGAASLSASAPFHFAENAEEEGDAAWSRRRAEEEADARLMAALAECSHDGEEPFEGCALLAEHEEEHAMYAAMLL